jgi:hypothetical protein
VCNMHCTHGGDEKRGLPGLTSKPVAMVCQWFGLKTIVTVSWFGPQNQGRRFGDLDLEITATVSCLGLKTKWEEVCQFAPHNRWAPCFIVKQVELGFPSFASKLAKERQRVVHMAASWRSRGSEVKDGRFDGVGCGAVDVGPNYHSFDVISLLAHRGILVFWFSL